MKFIIYLLLFLVLPAFAADIRVMTLVSDRTTTGSPTTVMQSASSKKSCQALGETTAGAGAAAVKVQGSNDNAQWVDLGTITLTLATTTSTDGFAIDSPWLYTRGNVSSISGTGANVTLVCSYEKGVSQ